MGRPLDRDQRPMETGGMRERNTNNRGGVYASHRNGLLGVVLKTGSYMSMSSGL